MKTVSSTNRSDLRNSRIADYYITPIPSIKQFLEAFDDAVGDLSWEQLKILDPCAGGDKNNPMSYPTAIKDWHGVDVDTIDIREDSRADTIADYLTCELDYVPDIIITNPPFNQAEAIVRKAINDVQENGYVIMLLRLNFLGSKQRKPFWEEHMAKYIFVHHKRMSFVEKGGTDSIEYAHFVFQKGHYPDHSMLWVI